MLKTILSYVQESENRVMPVYGTSDYFSAVELLTYISTELHGVISALFNPTVSDEVKEYVRSKFDMKLRYLERFVLDDGRAFLVGESFSVADAYLYVVLKWTEFVSIDIGDYPNVNRYFTAINRSDYIARTDKIMEDNPSYI
jgi:glutathione S-transferase